MNQSRPPASMTERGSRRERTVIEVTNARWGGYFFDVVRAALFLGVAAGIVGGATAIGSYAYYARDLPEIPDFGALRFDEVDTIEASDGQIIGESYEERRLMIPYERLPKTLILAFLATEDTRFFSHSGLDLRGIARAALQNLRAGSVVEGGSTITQQLSKSWLGGAKKFARKAKEAIFARRLEAVYGKEELLLLYLNKIYLGHQSHGVQAAAQNYYRKNVWSLTLGEMALLAGLPQSPSRLNPVFHRDRALERRAWVLDRMADAGFITDEQAETAAAERLVVHPLSDELGDSVPYFAERVRRWFSESFPRNAVLSPFTIETTADVELSQAAELALQDGLMALDRRQGYRGPLARIDSFERWGELLDRAQATRRGEPQPGDILVSIVTEARESGIRVALDRNTAAWVDSEGLAWAGKYSEFAVDQRTGKRDDSKRVSLDPKLDDPRDAFKKGDVILVRLLDPGPAIEARRAKLPRPLSDGLPAEVVQLPRVEGALLATRRGSHDVVAYLGGFDWDSSKFDRVVAPRQTGSTMKPIVYSQAYAKGFAPSQVVSGAPYNEDGYNPTGKKVSKDLMAWDALIKSENSVSLRIWKWVRDNVDQAEYQAWSRQLGLSRPLRGYPSEVLGTDQSLWDMTTAFACFADRGERVEPRMVRRVRDGLGRTIYRDLRFTDPFASAHDLLDAAYDEVSREPAQAIPKEIAWLTASNLSQVTKRGTAKAAGKRLAFPAAGKTGTLPYDTWFLGFTGDFIAGVWVGADRRERTLGRSVKRNRVYGSDTALPIWLDWVEDAHRRHPPGELVGAPPPGVEFASVDPSTGWLATGEPRVNVPHVQGTAPTRTKAPEGEESEFTGTEEFEF